MAVWIKFERDFLHRTHTHGHSVVKYHAGSTVFAPKGAADEALADGAGREATEQEIADAKGVTVEGETEVRGKKRRG